MREPGTWRPPGTCPICGDRLHLSRMSCHTCGGEVSGSFHTCEFCALDDDDRTLLRVFLSSFGNLREVQRWLGVSYPTARARMAALLERIGLEPSPGRDERIRVLESLARGDIDVDEAEFRLST